MSGSLHYRLPADGKYVDCSPSFRDAIGERERLTKGDIPYLEGWRDAGEKGADKLIDLLHEHEEIEVYIEY